MESTNNDIGASDPLTSTTMCTRKDDNEEESDLINSFFLPGGILDPEDNRADQSHSLGGRGGGGGRQINPPQDSFYLPPVEESWSPTRPLESPSPPQQPNNSNPLASDMLLSNRAMQGYRTSDSFFAGSNQQPPGLKLLSNESEEIRWFRAGSPSLQHDLTLDAFQGGQGISSVGRDPLINQTSILQSENNTYFGSPLVASAPAPIYSVFSIGSGEPLMTTGVIGSQLEQGSSSSNIVMQPPPGFHAIEPTAPTIPVPPKEDPPADKSVEAQPRASSNDNFQQVNSKVRQKKESSATENSWVGTSSKALGNVNKGNLKTSSRQLSGEARTYFEPLTVTLVESDEHTAPETEQQPVDERIEDNDTKINVSLASHDDTAQEVMQMKTIHSIENFHNKSNETFSNVSLPKKEEITGSPKKPTKTTPRSKPRGKNPTSTSRRIPEELSTPQDLPRLNGDSNGSTGIVLEPFQGILQWGDEILFPAIKQTFSTSSMIWKTIRLFAAVDYHVYSYAIQDVHTYETNDLIGLTFFQIPLINNILMRFFDAPHFTPHLVSYCILFFLCRPRKLVSAGSAETGSPSSMFGSTAKGPKDRVAADFGHYLCQTTLRCMQISLPFVFIFEGFRKPQTAIMRLTQCERIVVFYFLRSLRESIILSPIIWVTLLLQAILARLSDPNGFWMELVVIQCSLAIGMASVSFVRKQGEIGDGLQS